MTLSELFRSTFSQTMVLGLIGIFFVIIGDTFFYGKEILQEGVPLWDHYHNARSILIFIFTAAIFFGLNGNQSPKIPLFGSSLDRMINLKNFGIYPISEVAFFFVYGISTLLFLLGIFWPQYFNWLSYEDGFLEGSSALLLFVASALFFASFLHCNKQFHKWRILRFMFFLFFLLFFILGMEEISWFQRILRFDTPKIFSKNAQGEFNLHNFYTNISENLYYFGSFILLMVLPFICTLNPKLVEGSSLRLAIPRPFIIVLGAASSSFNFDMWNIIFTQITFYGSVVIIILMSRLLLSLRERRLMVIVALFLVFQQVVFLFNPSIIDFSSRDWVLTEYKEFLLPLTFFIFSLDVFFQMRALKKQ